MSQDNAIRNICVYCGASSGNDAQYAQAAQAFGRLLAERGLRLIYGGGHSGLMGTIANAVLEHGGEVIGVIPVALREKEAAHQGLTELHIVADMHERKAMMAEKADAFVAMPGGLGTLEELFEMLTWLQLGFHQKPIGLLNVGGFYDGLHTFLQHIHAEGFVRSHDANLLKSADDGAQLLQLLQSK